MSKRSVSRDSEIVGSIFANAVVVVFRVCAIGAENNAAVITLHNRHLHLKGKVREGWGFGKAGIKVIRLLHPGMICVSAELTTTFSTRTPHVPIVTILAAQWVIQRWAATGGLGVDAL